MEDNFAPQPEKQCSQSKCKVILPKGSGFKTCKKCHEIAQHSTAKKRQRENDSVGQPTAAPTQPALKAKRTRGVESVVVPSSDEAVSNLYHPRTDL
jgi:hypothetical protein